MASSEQKNHWEKQASARDGRVVKPPNEMVDLNEPNNWISVPVRNGGAIMLETGNDTHTTVAFFPRVDRVRLEDALRLVVKWARGYSPGQVQVRKALGEMWGKNSALVRKESELFQVHCLVREVLELGGFEIEDRPPHIEVVKKVVEKHSSKRVFGRDVLL